MLRLMAGGVGDTHRSDKSQRTHAQMRSRLQEQNRNLRLPLIFDGNVLCLYAQGERKRIRLACHPAHAHAHMSDSLLRKMLRRKTRAHRPHMMQQHTKTLKGTDYRYIDKL